MLESLKSKLEDLKHRWNSTDADIHLYSFVAEEIEGGRIHKGLWLKALSESQSDEAKAKAKYTKYRVAAVRKVMPEVAELAAAEELETQVVISLENRIASAESRVRDSSIEYQQVTTALDFNSAQHKSLQKKLAGINTDYKQKLADQHFIREAIKETWRKRLGVSIVAAIFLFLVGFLFDVAITLEYAVVAALAVFIISIFILRGPTFRERKNLSSQLQDVASKLRSVKSDLSSFDAANNQAKELEQKIAKQKSKVDTLRKEKESRVEKIQFVRQSIVDMLAI